MPGADMGFALRLRPAIAYVLLCGCASRLALGRGDGVQACEQHLHYGLFLAL